MHCDLSVSFVPAVVVGTARVRTAAFPPATVRAHAVHCVMHWVVSRLLFAQKRTELLCLLWHSQNRGWLLRRLTGVAVASSFWCV